MRAVVIASVCLVLSATAARAEDMILTNKQGIMCRDEKSLADFTALDGSVKRTVTADPTSADANRFRTACRDGGNTVQVIMRRRNTSIVTFEGATWYVPNIAYLPSASSCVKEGTTITVAGVIAIGFYDPDNGTMRPYHYPYLKLDKPVCYEGDHPDKAVRTISLFGEKRGADAAMMKMAGRRATVSGEVGEPDTGSWPPDPMMMNNAVVKPAG